MPLTSLVFVLDPALWSLPPCPHLKATGAPLAHVPACQRAPATFVSLPFLLPSLFTDRMSQQPAAEPEVREFDPKSALIAPDEGLADLRRILTDAPRFLRAGGWVLLETGIDQHVALATLSAQLGYAESAGRPDMSGRPRFWQARKTN